DATGKNLVLVAKAYTDLRSGLKILRVIFKNVSHDPDAAQIGDAKPLRVALEFLSGRNVACNDEAINGRDDLDGVRDLARVPDLVHLESRHPQVLQLLRTQLKVGIH